MVVRIVSALVVLGLGACAHRADDEINAEQMVCLVGGGGGAGGPIGDTEMPLSRFEVCNNGIDDDGNGMLDDGCVCSIGAVQPCYPDYPSTAGVGACGMGVQTCVARGSTGAWAGCVGAGSPGAELCDNRIDDDCDGLVDEVCACDEGMVQPCYATDAAHAGVGRCVAGVQTCDPSAEFEGGHLGGWGVCADALGPVAESCNGVDDDCNGLVDDLTEVCNLVDDDCDGEADEEDACAALPPTFYLTPFWPPTGSGILPSTEPVYALREAAPEEAICAMGEVLIADRPGHLSCVPEPPSDCPPGTRHQWTDGEWDCVDCDVVVQFGYLFDFERACAPDPEITCPDGEVPTFDEETRLWECLPMCNDTDYDRAYHDGELVCVPC